MLAWRTAEYDIGGTNMQEQPTLSLKVNASYAPLASQSHYTSPSAALTKHNRGTKQSKAPARGTCKLSKAQSYFITPTILTRKNSILKSQGYLSYLQTFQALKSNLHQIEITTAARV